MARRPRTLRAMQTPTTQGCQVVELRRYTLHPGRRDALIELFDREFVEAQEELGMHVIGQFRNASDADQFVWLRGFADMESRARGLQAFYGGPVWAAHREAANATMLDSDNVLLLRPAWKGAAICAAATRAARNASSIPAGAVDVAIITLAEPASDTFLADCSERIGPALSRAGANVLGWYRTEYAPNNFPRLPVRDGEHVVVAISLFNDAAALGRFLASGTWERELARPVEHLPLIPTARSALHA
jgi:hypothetical protein